MKEEIKTRIITAMAQNLSSEQMALLNIVLCDSFKNIEIIGDPLSINITISDNDDIRTIPDESPIKTIY